MAPLLSCKFNMDTACVELKFTDGSMVSTDCIAVKDEIAKIYAALRTGLPSL